MIPINVLNVQIQIEIIYQFAIVLMVFTIYKISLYAKNAKNHVYYVQMNSHV